jgi:magnesium-transporting ATPase (P-type)
MLPRWQVLLLPVALTLAPATAGVLQLLLHPTLAASLLCALCLLCALHRAYNLLVVRLGRKGRALFVDRAERRSLQRKHRLLEKRQRKQDACVRRHFGSWFLHFLHCLDWFMMILRWLLLARTLYVGIMLVHLFMQCLSALLALLVTVLICSGYLWMFSLLMQLPLCQQLLRCLCWSQRQPAIASDSVLCCLCGRLTFTRKTMHLALTGASVCTCLLLCILIPHVHKYFFGPSAVYYCLAVHRRSGRNPQRLQKPLQ